MMCVHAMIPKAQGGLVEVRFSRSAHCSTPLSAGRRLRATLG